MAFDLETYKEITGPLSVDDLDFDSFHSHPVAPEHLRCLRYMHDVEQHTSCYLRNLLNTRAHHDPEISTFLTLWNHEEYWHGEALARVLAAHDEPAGNERVAAMRARLGWRITTSPLLWGAFSAVTSSFLAVHMTFGAVNEWTTQGGYARLVQETDQPVLAELLRRIMRQEGRHIDFYRQTAVAHLADDPGAQRTTRRALRALWSPVGAKAMPESEIRHLVRTLFGGPDGEAVAARIDRRIDGLPGLDGLGLMRRTVTRYG